MITPIFILTNLGRAAVCNAHVLLLNHGQVVGPEYFLKDFRAFENITWENLERTISAVCLDSQNSIREDNFGLWSHAKQEWLITNPPKFANHILCSCKKPITSGAKMLFHAHNLFVDRLLFESLPSASTTSTAILHFVVAGRSFRSNVRNMMRHEELPKWRLRFLYLAYVCLILNTGQLNLREIRKRFVVHDLTLENLHANFDLEWASLLDFMGLKELPMQTSPSKLLLQRMSWTGGSEGEPFRPDKLSSPDYKAEDNPEDRIINAFDLESKSYGHWTQFLTRSLVLFFADSSAIFVAIAGLATRARLNSLQSHGPQKKSPNKCRDILDWLYSIPGVPYMSLRVYSRYRFARARARLSKRINLQ